MIAAGCAAAATAGVAPGSTAAPAADAGPRPGDRVFITNEDSCTVSVIDPVEGRALGAVNLTSFDEDPRPPFRFGSGGLVPTHEAMIQKPLYRGAISLHGAALSPDGERLAVSGRGSSNVYLVDTSTLRLVGAAPNPLGGAVVEDRLPGGLLVGREPHEPTFAPNGAELWVAMRGEACLSVHGMDRVAAELSGDAGPGHSLRRRIATLPGPAMVAFAPGDARAVVVSQKASAAEILDLAWEGAASQVIGRRQVSLTEPDPYGFTPFVKASADGAEMWMTHKLSDSLSVLDPAEGRLTAHVRLSPGARPNHVEFVSNARGDAVYVSYGRVDDERGGPPVSRLGVIDRRTRRLVGETPSFGREAHGLWADPTGARLFVAHELDSLTGAPFAGQAVCSVFDVSDPFAPRRISAIGLGWLALPSGALRHKKSINLVYAPARTGSAG